MSDALSKLLSDIDRLYELVEDEGVIEDLVRISDRKLRCNNLTMLGDELDTLQSQVDKDKQYLGILLDMFRSNQNSFTELKEEGNSELVDSIQRTLEAIDETLQGHLALAEDLKRWCEDIQRVCGNVSNLCPQVL